MGVDSTESQLSALSPQGSVCISLASFGRFTFYGLTQGHPFRD